jgi:hypothetical protein
VIHMFSYDAVAYIHASLDRFHGAYEVGGHDRVQQDRDCNKVEALSKAVRELQRQLPMIP